MERKSFLLRLDPTTMEALRFWADDDLRSLNGQIEFVLRRALREAGRLSSSKSRGIESPDQGGEPAMATTKTPTDTSDLND
jgi:hypothetical protein